jgi:putative toxin-antitoxin system antitoxin component (TIGR02293 family)
VSALDRAFLKVKAEIEQSGAVVHDLQSATSKDVTEQQEAVVLQRATEVIGDRPDAMRWLGTPVRALGYATPISLLHDAKGREEVLIVLGRLEHGVL